MMHALKGHWPEYLIEAVCLGLFMISAFGFGSLFEHPTSPVHQALANSTLRRFLMGLAMGSTAVAIIYSPWGKQSGAHMNPAFTLAFYRLGKVAPWDTVFYVIAQFAGGLAGMGIVALIAGKLLAHPSVNYAPTLPGPGGAGVAFAAEALISFILVLVVLFVSNTQQAARFTGIFAGACVAAFIIFESPLSGMSMNPARTFGSAVLPGLWTGLWVYFLAPPLGMLAATVAYQGLNRHVACAKYHHQNSKRCIFCEHQRAKQNKLKLNAPAISDAPPT